MNTAHLQKTKPSTRSPDQPPTRLATVLEMWTLTTLFVFVVGALLQLQNLQISEQIEVAKDVELHRAQTVNEITRNNTPALGY